jgi:hypothetical protein
MNARLIEILEAVRGDNKIATPVRLRANDWINELEACVVNDWIKAHERDRAAGSGEPEVLHHVGHRVQREAAAAVAAMVGDEFPNLVEERNPDPRGPERVEEEPWHWK